MYKVTIKQSNFCLNKVNTIGLAFAVIDNYCSTYNCVYGISNISIKNVKINVTVIDKYNTPIELVIEIV